MTPKDEKGAEPAACPFCGHIGLDFAEGSTFRWLDYSCGGCGMGSETRMQTMGAGTLEQWRAEAERDAIKEWNRRATPPGELDSARVREATYTRSQVFQMLKNADYAPAIANSILDRAALSDMKGKPHHGPGSGERPQGGIPVQDGG
jgi:hypothetical protein